MGVTQGPEKLSEVINNSNIRFNNAKCIDAYQLKDDKNKETIAKLMGDSDSTYFKRQINNYLSRARKNGLLIKVSQMDEGSLNPAYLYSFNDTHINPKYLNLIENSNSPRDYISKLVNYSNIVAGKLDHQGLEEVVKFEDKIRRLGITTEELVDNVICIDPEGFTNEPWKVETEPLKI